MITELYLTPAVPYPCLQKSVKEVEQQRLPCPSGTRAPRRAKARHSLHAHELANDSAAILAQALVAGHLKL